MYIQYAYVYIKDMGIILKEKYICNPRLNSFRLYYGDSYKNRRRITPCATLP